MTRKIVIFIIIIVTTIFLYLKFFSEKKVQKIDTIDTETSFNSNILENVEYISQDSKGNEYIIRAAKGEIDLKNTNIIFLKDVKSVIKLTSSEEINITSNFGKYNTVNFDTIFSKNVIINYLENEIVGEYLDFSILRNTMIIRKNVKYSNSKNTLFADVIEMDIETKDTKIYMHEGLKKVNIKSKE